MQAARLVRGFSTARVFRKSTIPRTASEAIRDREGQVKWFKSLKSDELKDLAIAYGAPCSGTKDVLSRGLVDVLDGAGDGRAPRLHAQPLSVVSIDMGIRNLAYCHLRCSSSTEEQLYKTRRNNISIDTWRRMDVSTGAAQGLEPEKGASTATKKLLASKAEDEGTTAPLKESFDPIAYAERAYALVSRILEDHQPTHVLIERQRFRSGGGPAVQEWTLRVGMFEFMIYATLHTLRAQGKHSSSIVPVLPPMVNRYWISEIEKSGIMTESKPTSTAMKRYKINHVRSILETREAIGRQVELSGQAGELASAFLSKLNGDRRTSRSNAIPKLDDLSDCLLQGLAWVAWQENRRRIHSVLESGLTPTDPLALK